jgi:hypothetical protein
MILKGWAAVNVRPVWVYFVRRFCAKGSTAYVTGDSQSKFAFVSTLERRAIKPEFKLYKQAVGD